jgi:hypothetical protein
MTEPKTTIPSADVVALPDRSFRMKRYLIVLMLVGMGLWFCLDGFYRWPAELREAETLRKQQLTPNKEPHSQTDIFWNQVLGVVLPPIGFLALAWFLYGSRGRYRLSGQTLYVPGHEPIPIEAITVIDKSKWERKGIARIEYESAGKPRSLRLDNFVYQEEPTRLIVKRLEEALFPEEQNAPPSATP